MVLYWFGCVVAAKTLLIRSQSCEAKCRGNIFEKTLLSRGFLFVFQAIIMRDPMHIQTNMWSCPGVDVVNSFIAGVISRKHVAH